MLCKVNIFRLFILPLFLQLAFAGLVFGAEIPKVAVFDLYADDVSPQITSVCSEILRQVLTDEGRMILIARSEMERILTAQGETMVGCYNEEGAVRLGRLLSMEKIITSTITVTGEWLWVFAKFIDLETGGIEFQKNIKIANEPWERLIECMPQLARKISNGVTIVGEVIRVNQEHSELKIDLGKGMGMKVGDRLDILRCVIDSSELQMRDVESVGTVQIIDFIGEDYSVCSILSGSNFQNGDYTKHQGTTPDDEDERISNQRYGSLNIRTVPQGARVFLDGNDIGTTPLHRDDIKIGDYTLLLQLVRYSVLTQSITVKLGESTEVDTTMVGLTGSLQITTFPVGASIFLDGEYEGVTGDKGLTVEDVLIGSCVVKAHYEGYLSCEKTVEIENKTTTFEDIKLKPKSGAIFVISIPESAEVILDDSLLANELTPVKLNDIETGSHKVTVNLMDYKSAEKFITVEPDKTFPVSIELVRITREDSVDALCSVLPDTSWVFFSADSFMMGSPEGENGRDEDEGPQHLVFIKPFGMMKTEVTQALWLEVMGTTVQQQRNIADPSEKIYGEGSQFPMYYVTWNEVQVFLEKLNLRDPGKDYRLPTEAEWEYACRARTTSRYYWGEDSGYGDIGYYAEYSSSRNDLRGTIEVGSKLPNSFGLHDMSGNVWEWCDNVWYDFHQDSHSEDSVREENSEKMKRILRGGSWSNNANLCRSANRHAIDPDMCSGNVGFRLVSDLIIVGQAEKTTSSAGLSLYRMSANQTVESK